ncbi:MAG TPA: UvrD-helicase domain-containing protein, partial [Bacteroidales bacterium]|nr:UvrD-helicase domain-containing protein [Bacteroidales bacterium]
MSNFNSILQSLNDPQREAVQHIDGPLMVIAGAGSGKTRVLTHRVAYMLEQKINPYSILALTFTNKAAKEMKERVVQLVGDSLAKAVMMGTFHSVFYKIIRIEAEKLGFTRNVTVYDTDDSKSLIRNIVKEMDLDPKIYSASIILNRISSAKSNLLNHEDYAANPEILAMDGDSGRPFISDIFMRYNIRLKQSDAMDFDDLL